MTGRMSLDVSEILIKFRNLSRLFELFGCVVLDSLSVLASSLADTVFSLRAWPQRSKGNKL